MIFPQSLVLAEEKPADNLFGCEKGYLDAFMSWPRIIDFAYQKNENTWALSWYDFNLRLKYQRNCQEILKKIDLYEYIYSGPGTGKKTQIVFPSQVNQVGFLNITKGYWPSGFSPYASNICERWFDLDGRKFGWPMVIRYTKQRGDREVRTYELNTVSGRVGINEEDYDLILKRYFTVLSEEEKELIWEKSGYSRRSEINWITLKEVYNDL